MPVDELNQMIYNNESSIDCNMTYSTEEEDDEDEDYNPRLSITKLSKIFTIWFLCENYY